MNGIEKATAAPRGNYLSGIATPEKMKEQMLLVDRGCSLYYVMMGSIFNVMNSAMVEAMCLVRQNKRFFRQQVKHDFNKAVECFDAWVVKMKNTLGSRFQLWLDVSDKVDEDLRMDVVKLNFAFDNYLLKNGEPDNKMKASIQTVITLLDIADLTCEKMFDEVQHQCGRDIRPLFRGATMKDVKFYWNRACKPIQKCKDNRKEIDFNDSNDCKLAVMIIMKKISDINLYNRASSYALHLNPEQWKYLSKEDRLMLKQGASLDIEEEIPEPTEEQINNLKSKFS